MIKRIAACLVVSLLVLVSWPSLASLPAVVSQPAMASLPAVVPLPAAVHLVVGAAPVSTQSDWSAGWPDDPLLRQQDWPRQHGLSLLFDTPDSGRGVRVGLIDSGLVSQHEDLNPRNILSGKNYTDAGSPLVPADRDGHGTFIAGLLLSVPGNGLGTAGLVPAAELLPLKCFDPASETRLTWLVQAIDDAIAQNCQVLNLSFGFAGDAPELSAALQRAADQGILLVAPVGDLGYADKPLPARHLAVAGVGALAAASQIAPFSQQNDAVLVVAPGSGLKSLGSSRPDAYQMDGRGTSFATAFVTALAVRAKQLWPEIRAQQFRWLLAASAQDLGQPGYDVVYGFGSLDVTRFLALMKQLQTDPQLMEDGLLAQQKSLKAVPTSAPVNSASTIAAWSSSASTSAVLTSPIFTRARQTDQSVSSGLSTFSAAPESSLLLTTSVTDAPISAASQPDWPSLIAVLLLAVLLFGWLIWRSRRKSS